MTWQDDKRWSDRFLPEIKAILGVHLIGEPPVEEDAGHNTDLIVLKMEAVRIACRVRTYEYYQRYPDEFTVRAERPSGNKTELAKIVEGWGQYMFYGFSDEPQQQLIAWVLLDLNVFRLWHSSYLVNHKSLPGKLQSNTDGSSKFYVYQIHHLPQEFIVAQCDTARVL